MENKVIQKYRKRLNGQKNKSLSIFLLNITGGKYD